MTDEATLLDCLSRQLDELTLLLAIFGDAVHDAEALEATLAAAREACDEGRLPDAELAIGIELLSTAPAAVDGQVKPVAFTAVLRVELPRSYPACARPHWSLDAPASYSRAEHTEVLRAGHAALEGAEGSECIAGLADAVRDALHSVRQQLADDVVAWEEEQRLQDDAAAAELSSVLAAERTLGRRCIYYHHILGVGKRQCIEKWGRQFQLNGFCKIGYPGVLIVEGPECGVAEYVRWLQRLRWKLMVVRGEERYPLLPDQALDAARRIPSHGVIEMVDASELADRCRTADLESLFLTSMKIYR